MEVLAKKLYKIMHDKNLKKTKVSLVFLSQLAGLDFLSFNQLQKLQEQLGSLNIYFKQMSVKEFCLFNVGELSEVKPLRMSQQEVDVINNWTDKDFINININSNKKNASNCIIPSSIDNLILDLWYYLVSNAGAKPTLNIVTFKDVSGYLKLGNHLKAKPLLTQIKRFCQSENIPNLTRIVVNASSKLPDKEVEWEAWSNEIRLISSFNYSEYEDKFLNNYEILNY